MLEIKIPFRTPSLNHLYGQRGSMRFLTKEAKELKKTIKELVDRIKSSDYKPLGKLVINVDIYEDWFTKDGSIKKKDISNREKFLIDSIFESLGIDDKQIFRHTMTKIQSSEEFALIRIFSYE